MTTELIALYSTGILTFFLVFIQGMQVPLNFGFKWGLGNRDEPRSPTLFMQRVGRTLDNQMQAMTIAVPVFLLVILNPDAQNTLTQVGAFLFVAGRIGFAALYLIGVPVLRSIIWGVGMTGTLLVAYGGISALV